MRNTLTIPEWGDVFTGKQAGDSRYSGYRGTVEDFERWMYLLVASDTASVHLSHTEDFREFFTLEEDLALLIPKPMWEEAFFSMKNGFVAPYCPAPFIWFAKAIFRKYKMCNLIGPALPRDLKVKVQKKDYFGAGYTATDAICNFVCNTFQPITSERILVSCGDWYEAYIQDTELVAALPLRTGKLLSQSDVVNIKLNPSVGLMLHGKPLCMLDGVEGVTSNYYDLRRPV